MKKKKKGKVRWLAVLLAGCLLLSIVPVTAFASEDTDPTKSENAVGEETQLTVAMIVNCVWMSAIFALISAFFASTSA